MILLCVRKYSCISLVPTETCFVILNLQKYWNLLAWFIAFLVLLFNSF